YYPRPKEEPIAPQEIVTALGVVEAALRAALLAGSYLGPVGRFIEPVMRPLGLDWRAGVALLTSIPAKELVVSSMAVLYGGDDIASLSENITTRSGITPRSAVAFMIFILLFFPCIGTLATIRSETGSRGWMWFTIIYNTSVAWLLAWLAYLIL
ncbi:MAG: ferrous iron transport protein B, partial [Tidjanibacter sp.]|nr:ferrous iron transport protein B [Tidjanibacter sp.]